jgi:hypothetical protein
MRPVVLHLSKYAPFRGGMDKVLRLHAANVGGTERLLHWLRRPTADAGEPGAGIHLPMGWLRRRLSAAQREAPPQVSLYYNCWGADTMRGSDRAEVKVGYLHNYFPQFEHYVRYYGQFLDGFLSVSAPMHEAVCRVIPSEMRANSHWLRYPLETQFRPPAIPAARCVIGLCGRIIREQKRLDRLPELLARLDQTGLDYRVELLGDGPDRCWLTERLAAHPRVIFHGWCEGEKQLAVMQSWKYVASLSDYEGQSIALLEGIAAGCLPLYPDFHTGAELPPAAARRCLYPTGDMAALAMRLHGLETASAVEITVLRAELAALICAHAPASYQAAFNTWAHGLHPLNRRRAIASWRRLIAPVWAYNRFYRRLTHI